jgi:hypothetical protein
MHSYRAGSGQVRQNAAVPLHAIRGHSSAGADHARGNYRRRDCDIEGSADSSGKAKGQSVNDGFVTGGGAQSLIKLARGQIPIDWVMRQCPEDNGVQIVGNLSA